MATEFRPSLLLSEVRRTRRPPAELRLAELAAALAAEIETSDLGQVCRELLAAAQLLVWKLRWLIRPWDAVSPADEPAAVAGVPPPLAEAVGAVVAFLQERQAAGLESFGPLARPKAADRWDITLEELTEALEVCLRRGPAGVETISLAPRVPLVVLLRRLEVALLATGRLNFSAFLAQLNSRDEAVAAFLALLVLAGRGRVRAYQPQPFGDIILEALGSIGPGP
mgnify:CR=1 FL=1